MFDAKKRIARGLRALAGLPAPELGPIRLIRRLAQGMAEQLDAAPRPAPVASRAPRPMGRKAPLVTVAALRDRIERRERVLIIDVREPVEAAHGMIPGARSWPIASLLVQLAELRADGRPVVLYCQDGTRASYAGEHLLGDGIEAVEVLAGGYDGWQAAGGGTSKLATELPN